MPEQSEDVTTSSFHTVGNPQLHVPERMSTIRANRSLCSTSAVFGVPFALGMCAPSSNRFVLIS